MGIFSTDFAHGRYKHRVGGLSVIATADTERNLTRRIFKLPSIYRIRVYTIIYDVISYTAFKEHRRWAPGK